jgi:GNAT superfamily N-acetyltransferase
MSLYRKLLPTEMSRYRDHLLRLDRADRHLRFAGTVSDAAIQQHCLRLDWHDTVVIGFFDRGELSAAAELRFDGKPFSRRAEAGFSVERRYQGQGVGKGLMARVLTIARNRGIRVVDVICLLENRRMQSLASKFSSIRVVDSGEVGVSIGLDQANHISVMLEAIDESAGLVSVLLDSFKFDMGKFNMGKVLQ